MTWFAIGLAIYLAGSFVTSVWLAKMAFEIDSAITPPQMFVTLLVWPIILPIILGATLANRAHGASVDTLPKGQDGEAGLVRSKGSAVPKADDQTSEVNND